MDLLVSGSDVVYRDGELYFNAGNMESVIAPREFTYIGRVTEECPVLIQIDGGYKIVYAKDEVVGWNGERVRGFCVLATPPSVGTGRADLGLVSEMVNGVIREKKVSSGVEIAKDEFIGASRESRDEDKDIEDVKLLLEKIVCSLYQMDSKCVKKAEFMGEKYKVISRDKLKKVRVKEKVEGRTFETIIQPLFADRHKGERVFTYKGEKYKYLLKMKYEEGEWKEI